MVAVSKNWLNTINADIFQMLGYKFVCDSRVHKLVGGVGLYIQCDFKIRSDLQSTNTSLYESMFTEIVQPQEKNTIVGCFY